MSPRSPLKTTGRPMTQQEARGWSKLAAGEAKRIRDRGGIYALAGQLLHPHGGGRGQEGGGPMTQKNLIHVWNEAQRTPASVYGDANYGPGNYEIRVSDDAAGARDRLGGIVYNFNGGSGGLVGRGR